VEFGLVADRRSLRAKGKVVPFGQLLEGKETGQERGNSSACMVRTWRAFLIYEHSSS